MGSLTWKFGDDRETVKTMYRFDYGTKPGKKHMEEAGSDYPHWVRFCIDLNKHLKHVEIPILSKPTTTHRRDLRRKKTKKKGDIQINYKFSRMALS